jgi:hypothetical protein
MAKYLNIDDTFVMIIEDTKPKVRVSPDLRRDMKDAHHWDIPEWYYPFTVRRWKDL